MLNVTSTRLGIFWRSGIATKQKLATVPVERRRSHPCPSWPFCGGLLSSPAARSVFWVLQAWPVGPVGFHRFMPRTPAMQKASMDPWEMGTKWKNIVFFARLGFPSFFPQNYPKFLTKVSSQLWIFFIFSSYLRHVHHHHPSSQVDPCTVSSSYVKSTERRSQPLKKLQPRKLPSNWASGNEAKFWDESSYNLDHLIPTLPHLEDHPS